MTKKIQNKGARNAHILLGVYWVSKVLGGRHPLKAAIDVLEMDGRLVISEARRARAEKQADKKRGTYKKSADKESLRASEAAPLPTGRRKESASLIRAASGIVHSRFFKKTAGAVLRSGKVV